MHAVQRMSHRSLASTSATRPQSTFGVVIAGTMWRLNDHDLRYDNATVLQVHHVFSHQADDIKLNPGAGSTMQLQQRLLNPLQQLAADRCHLTRDTGAAIANSGLFARVEAEPPLSVQGAGLIAPHAAGIAYV